MCLAICTPALNAYDDNVDEFDYDWIRNAWPTNPDGAGFSYASVDGKVHIKKGYTDLEEFIANLDWYRYANPMCNFLIHLRWASAGEISEENTHPFYIGETNTAFIHNGTIYPMKPKGDDKRSDTQIFAEFLTELPEEWYKDAGITELVEDFLGSSKIALIDSYGDIYIFNEHLGEYVGETWMSNDYYTGDYIRNDKGVKIKKPVEVEPEVEPEVEMEETVTQPLQFPEPLEHYGEGECAYCGCMLETPDEKHEGICINCAIDIQYGYGLGGLGDY